MHATDPILTIKNLQNYYHSHSVNIFEKSKKIKVLKGVNIDIKRGEIFGLVGESGCGKSTLGGAIVGLVEAQGDIILEGEKMEGRRRKDLCKKVQIVFQDPMSSLNPKKKIGWILEEPMKIHKIGNKEERKKRVEEVLELIGLDPSYRDRYPRELSGGQRQRISIGCALMLNPKLLIADEPVSSLDVSVQSQILNIMMDLHDKLNLSYLFISHNLNVVYYLCDRVAVMYFGRIVELSDVKTIYDNPLHPYTQELLNAIPRLDSESGFGDIQDKNLESVDREIKESNIPQNGCEFSPRCPKACAKCRELVPELSRVIDGPNEHFVRCHMVAE